MIKLTNKNSNKSKYHAVKLLPHQKCLLEKVKAENNFPIFICWGMGSGKTIGACMCMSLLPSNSKVLIICDKTTVIQWKLEAEKMLSRNHEMFPELEIDLIHYEYLNQDLAPEPRAYQLTIVDEAHRFRNAWAKESSRMLNWMYMIQECQRVIYLSGTPIVHDAIVEREAFNKMMGTQSLSGRVFFYDPRSDPKAQKKYPKTEEKTVKSEMSWAQCFVYLQNRRQKFEIHLEDEDEPRSRMSSSKNTYNTLLRSISNNPFPENPASSPKFQTILTQLDEYNKTNCKQIVYSSRRDLGVKALQSLWDSIHLNENGEISGLSFAITGDMTTEDRAYSIQKFNRSPKSVLFITDAAAQGIDLKRVDVVHLIEPSENLQDERQIINRAVRYKSHTDSDSMVTIVHYISTFPVSGSVSAPWKHVLYESGMFDKHEMKGITRKVQYALQKIIKEEENSQTIDEKIIQVRSERETKIQSAISTLMKDAAFVL